MDGNLVVRPADCSLNDEDFCSALGGDEERLELSVSPGTYYVIVDTIAGTEGTYFLSMELAPSICGDGVVNPGEECDLVPPTPTDGCVDPFDPGECTFEDPDPITDVCPGEAIDIPAGDTLLPSAQYSTLGFINDYESENCNFFPNGGGVDRVFEFNPGLTGTMTIRIGFDAAGTTPFCDIDLGDPRCWDQLIYARSVCDAQGSELDCSDDAFGDGEEIAFPVTQDVPVWVIVDGYYDQAAGPFNLHINLQ
jgi:hypothetical protein